MTSHFNLKTFSKILALAESTPIQDHPAMEKERGAAWDNAKAMAEAAGMTLDAAVRLARGEAPEQPQPKRAPSIFWGDLFRDQDEKRAAAARHPWPEHPMERRLREALVGHCIKETWFFSNAEPETLTAIRNAIPFLTDMLTAIAEEAAWNTLEDERDGIMPEYRVSDGPLIRRDIEDTAGRSGLASGALTVRHRQVMGDTLKHTCLREAPEPAISHKLGASNGSPH